MPPGPEDIAREQIDPMLISAEWAVQDAKAVNLYAKQGVPIREFELKSGFGTADYLLCNSIDLTPRRLEKIIQGRNLLFVTAYYILWAFVAWKWPLRIANNQ